MTSLDQTQLLSAVWRMGHFVGATLYDDDGRRVEVKSSGEPTAQASLFKGAVLVIDGVVYCGDVVVGAESPITEPVVMRIVECSSPRLLDLAGDMIPQMILPVPQPVLDRYQQLVDGGVDRCKCGTIVAQMDSLHRTDLLTRLVIERLQRKCSVVERLYGQSDSDWNQTMYAMLFRAMGDHRNQDAFERLAFAVPYYTLSRERTSGDNVETMLFGASGLLRRYYWDEHTRVLQQDFEYLARKHSIRPMMGGEWAMTGINPNNTPLIRISQLAGYVSHTDFIFNKLLQCRTADDINRLLGGESARVSDYWERHFTPERTTVRKTKRLGATKINLLGINFVVPVMFAYGRQTEREELKEQALDLLDSLRVETNYITRHWTSRGVVLNGAFDSQAIIQLEREYCSLRGCWRCPIGRSEIKKSLETL